MQIFIKNIEELQHVTEYRLTDPIPPAPTIPTLTTMPKENYGDYKNVKSRVTSLSPDTWFCALDLMNI